MSTSGGIRDLFRSGHRNAPAVPGVVPIRKLGREPASLSFASIDPKPQKQPPPVALRPIQEIAARVQGHVPVQNLQIARLQPKAEPHLRIKRRRRSLERTHPIEGASAPSFKPFDFCLISVPFGHYDEPEILRYEINSICPIRADVKQSLDCCKFDPGRDVRIL